MTTYTRKDFLPTVSHVQPFVARDSYTYVELIFAVQGQFDGLQKDMKEILDNGAHIANLVNDRVGEIKPFILDSNIKREQDLVIPKEMPGDHNFWIVWKQNAAGTGRLFLPSNVTGEVRDPGPGGTAFIHVMPIGNEHYTINDPAALTQTLLKPINDWVRAIDEREKTATEELKGQIRQEKEIAEQAASAIRRLLTATEGELRKFAQDKALEAESRERARAEGVEGPLRNELNVAKGDISTIQTRLGQLDGLDSDLKRAVEVTLPGQISGERTAREQAFQELMALLQRKADADHLGSDVKRFGARGDGVTDDTAAIRAAIADAGKDGLVVFPKGVYVVKQTLKPILGQRWIGASWNSDSRSPRNTGENQGANSLASILIDGPELGIDINKDLQCHFQNLRIDSARPSQGTGVNVQSSSLTFENVTISGFKTGIKFEECWYGKITNLTVSRCDRCVHVVYCYNLTFNDLRCYPLGANGKFGTGMYLDNRSMVTVNGGSMEDYLIGFWLKNSSSISFHNMYFESIQDVNNAGPFTVCTLDSNTLNTTINASGNQVYMDSHDAFIDMGKTPAGETLIAHGNHFKVGDTQPVGTGICYKWNQNNGSRINVVLFGDSMVDSQNKCKYIPDIAFAPMGSLIVPPAGVAAQSQGYGAHNRTIVGGSLHVTGHHAVNGEVPHIYLTPVEGTLPQASAMPGWQGKNVGAMIFSKTHNKPVWWTGNGWVDAAGQAKT